MILDKKFYDWNCVLLWGTFRGHFEKSCYEKTHYKRFIHMTIAAIEFLPIISQISSIFEKLIVEVFAKEERSLNNLKMWNRKEIINYHEKIGSFSNYKELFTWSRWSDACVMPSMSGLKQIANYLTQRHGFQKDCFVVCLTLAEFRENLNSISLIQHDVRKAFVIPTHSSSWGQKQDGQVAKRSEEFPQHIITVVAEKKEGRIHIALLDPVIRSENQVINPDHIGLHLDETVPFTEQELVLSYILSSNLPFATTTLYHSTILREVSNGCWAFALKDAIAFLKSATFFTDIKVQNTSTTIGTFILKGIETLPFEWMKTAQLSNAAFQTYFTQHPDQDNEKARKKIAKHQVEGQNQRIGHATVKWIEKLLQIQPNSFKLL